MKFVSSRADLRDPQGPFQDHVSIGAGQGGEGAHPKERHPRLCQEVAREAGEACLLPAQPWPCHAGPREAEETVWGRGWQQRGSLSFPPARGRQKAITVSQQQADTLSVPAVTDTSFF